MTLNPPKIITAFVFYCRNGHHWRMVGLDGLCSIFQPPSSDCEFVVKLHNLLLQGRKVPFSFSTNDSISLGVWRGNCDCLIVGTRARSVQNRKVRKSKWFLLSVYCLVRSSGSCCAKWLPISCNSVLPAAELGRRSHRPQRDDAMNHAPFPRCPKPSRESRTKRTGHRASLDTLRILNFQNMDLYVWLL